MNKIVCKFGSGVILACLAIGFLSSCQDRPSLPRMVLVSGGSFEMGVAGGKDDPLHRVEVSSFYLAPYDVTVADWREYTDDAKTGFNWNQDFSGAGGAPTVFHSDDPMEFVTWWEALEYCNWISKKYGLAPVYRIAGSTGYTRTDKGWVFHRATVKWNRNADGFRLPTEAEWEYAARGGDKSRGTIYAGSNDLSEVGWYRGNSGERVHPIGQKLPNELGLYDMGSDVGNWCWDFYSPTYYRESPRRDPIGPSAGSTDDPDINAEKLERFVHVVRGTIYFGTAEWARVYQRALEVDAQRSYTGFRLARNSE